MATDTGYSKRDYLRVCDICGHRFHFSDLKPIGEMKFACPDDAPGLTATQISRFNARAKPLVVRPNRHAKGLTQTPIYQLAEAEIFNFIASVAPANQRDGSPEPLAAAWAAIYMAEVISQDKRPTLWDRKARTTIQTCLTYLLTLQYGSLTGTAGTADNPRYGGILVDGDYSTKVTIAAGIAFLKAFSITGSLAYRDAADRCAVFLRHVQCGDLQASAYTVFPSGGGRYHIGGLASGVVDSTGLLETDYLIADIAGLWFLELLADVRGTTAMYGDATATAFFSAATSATVATMRTELLAFAELGARDSDNGGELTPGLSTTAPRATYQAAVNGGTGGGTWAAIDVIPSDDICLALRGLHEAGASVDAMMTWLEAFGSNEGNRTPATMPESQELAGITGTYDPTIAPASALKTAAPFTEDDQAVYSWSSQGLLAPIRSSRSLATFRASKDAVSMPRRYSAFDITKLYIGPIGGSGLSLQPRTRQSLIDGTPSGQLPATSYTGPTGLGGMPTLGLVQWVRGDLGLEVAGGRVSAWRDQSDLGQDFEQPNPTNYPYYTGASIDGIPCISFGAAGDANKALITAGNFKDRNGDAISGSHTRTVMAVVRPRFDAAWGVTGGQVWNHVNWQALFDLENAFTLNGAHAWARAWRDHANAMDFSPIVGGAGGPYDGTPVLLEWRSTGSPNLEFRINNVLVALTPSTMPGADGGTGQAYISATGVISFLGEMSEVAVFDWAIDAATRGAAVSSIGGRYASLGLADSLTAGPGVVAAAKTGLIYRQSPGHYPQLRG